MLAIIISFYTHFCICNFFFCQQDSVLKNRNLTGPTIIWTACHHFLYIAHAFHTSCLFMAVRSKRARHAWLTLQLPSPSSWRVLRKSRVSLECSASQVSTAEAHEPTRMPAPAEHQWRCSPNKFLFSALCIASRGKGSNPDWLLSQGRIHCETFLPKELQWCTIKSATTPPIPRLFLSEVIQALCTGFSDIAPSWLTSA